MQEGVEHTERKSRTFAAGVEDAAAAAAAGSVRPEREPPAA